MIRKLKWKDHYSLGNLELDFIKADGTSYNTIILAGENGTGKTKILETLATFLNKDSMTPFDYIEYDAGGAKFHITPHQGSGRFGYFDRKNIDTGVEDSVSSSKYNDENKILEDTKDIRYYGVSYSKARSGFNAASINSVTTQQVDADRFEIDNQDDFTRIKQLIIDIDNQDSSEWLKRSKEGGISDDVYKEYLIQSKGYRFEIAFNGFFDGIKYNGIDNSDPNEIQILFEKHGRTIKVDDLSTGEKQIVYRGAQLLRNVNSIKGGIVLIDEPELSMHPLWQSKILNYYRGLFTSAGKQTVQMIIATHSDYVIRTAFKDPQNVLVITLKDDNGTITAKRVTAPYVLPRVTAAEANFLAFNILSIDYHIELYSYLQTKIGASSVSACDRYIASQRPYYDPLKHERIDNSHPRQQYQTLPTYIRNAIDHPDSGRTYTDAEFAESIKLLIELCKLP